jgi:uroporphyrinogen decarboxylase
MTVNAPVTRRRFVSALSLAAASTALAAGAKKANRREALLSLRKAGPGPGFVPAAFFLHFDEKQHFGQAAVDAHLAYFHATGMDFVKVQYERTFPVLPEIRTPGDWKNMPRYGLDFYRPQLEVVEGLVKAAGKEALVLVTLYSPFMCAGHTASRPLLVKHLEEDGDAVRKGLDTITESLLGFVRECRRLGVDGFYASTQGGEAGSPGDARFFKECIMPADLTVMREINETCRFNILHICDYVAPYADLSPFLAYPGHIVNCNPRLTTGALSLREVSRMFGRPVMGGMDRKGVIVSGTADEIRRAAREVLDAAPERFILGADCTLPETIAWENIRTAIDAAHARGPSSR